MKALKAGNKAYRRRLRGELARLGFDERHIIRHVASELVRDCSMRPRTAWRLANELTLEQAAARFNVLLNDPQAPMKGSRIWDYEQWPHRGVRPSAKALCTLGAVYGVPWTSLVDVEDLRQLPEQDLVLYRAAAEGMAPPGDGIPDPHGRESGVPGAGAPASTGAEDDMAASVARSARESRDLAMSVTETNVDEELLACLKQELAEVTHLLPRSPLHVSFHRAVQLRDHVSALLRGRQRLAFTRELTVLAAKSCALLAWISEELGHHAAALAHARAGWMCAEQADHDGARRWVRVVRSRMAFWAGDLVESTRLAADVHEHPSPDAVDPCLTLLEGRGPMPEALSGDDPWTDAERAFPPDGVPGAPPNRPRASASASETCGNFISWCTKTPPAAG